MTNKTQQTRTAAYGWYNTTPNLTAEWLAELLSVEGYEYVDVADAVLMVFPHATRDEMRDGWDSGQLGPGDDRDSERQQMGIH